MDSPVLIGVMAQSADDNNNNNSIKKHQQQRRRRWTAVNNRSNWEDEGGFVVWVSCKHVFTILLVGARADLSCVRCLMESEKERESTYMRHSGTTGREYDGWVMCFVLRTCWSCVFAHCSVPENITASLDGRTDRRNTSGRTRDGTAH